jgi:hypothetical protein
LKNMITQTKQSQVNKEQKTEKETNLPEEK